MSFPTTARGFTLIEFLFALAIGGMIVAAIGSLTAEVTATREITEERLRLTRDAQFAMQRMLQAVSRSSVLLVPQADKAITNWRDHVREETVPASTPEGSSIKATAVLAVTLDAHSDLDADGFPDADNDRDGRIDEDLPADITNDSDPGVHLIDDGGDGRVDEGIFANSDDDELLSVSNEDPVNGADDDNDGMVDEDPGADMNGDGAPGISGVDDDGDGQIDEGSNSDDDEDGVVDEDWYDPVVFYLANDQLIERRPVPWETSGDLEVNGRDFELATIADNVTLLRFERVAGSFRFDVVDITLTLTGAGGESVSLQSRVRVGSDY